MSGCFFKTAVLPAAGFRNNTNGALNNVGTNGYYWSSTADGTTNAWNLWINSGGSNVNAHNRAFGFSVRCVQELTKKKSVGAHLCVCPTTTRQTLPSAG